MSDITPTLRDFLDFLPMACLYAPAGKRCPVCFGIGTSPSGDAPSPDPADTEQARPGV